MAIGGESHARDGLSCCKMTVVPGPQGLREPKSMRNALVVTKTGDDLRRLAGDNPCCGRRHASLPHNCW